MNCSPEFILDYLNRARVRCTYAAFADVLGVPRRSAGRHLGDRRPEASWVVSKTTGDPEGYADRNKHLELYRTDYIIETEDELRRCMRSNVTEFPPAWLQGGLASVGTDKQTAEVDLGDQPVQRIPTNHRRLRGRCERARVPLAVRDRAILDARLIPQGSDSGLVSPGSWMLG